MDLWEELVSTRIIASLSSDRIAPYLAAVDGNFVGALRLYEWNLAVSGATYEALAVVEVVLG